jgi:hypothetical protein
MFQAEINSAWNGNGGNEDSGCTRILYVTCQQTRTLHSAVKKGYSQEATYMERRTE